MTRPMFEPVTVGRYSDGSPVQVARVDAALLDVQGRRLGYTLTVLQGGRHEGGASGGTHSEWRAVDLAPFEAEQKERAGRNTGAASYHRLELPGVWGEHVHQATLIRGVADGVQADDLLESQMRGYRQSPPRDGLGPWPFGQDRDYVPNPRVEFDWQAFTEGRYDDRGHLTDKPRRALRDLRHNRDIRRAVRRLRAARRKAQNPAVARRLEQFVRELLRMRIRPQVHIDTDPH